MSKKLNNTPARKHVKGCHAGLDPESSPVLDSRFRGNDSMDIYCCRSNNIEFTINSKRVKQAHP